MSEQEAGAAITGANPTGAVRAATRDGMDQLAASGAGRAGNGLVAWARGIAGSVVDGFVVVAFLIFAGRARREALHADADRIAEQWRTEWGPSAAQSLAACQPDPVVQERILQQILATPRPAPSRLASARRWGRLVAALAVAVLLGVSAAVGAGSGDCAGTAIMAGLLTLDAGHAGGFCGGGASSSAANVEGLPACQVPPAGVRAPADVLLHVPDEPAAPMTVVYSHIDAAGMQVWYAYGPSGQVTVPGTRVTTGLFPPLPTMQVQTDELPDGHRRFRPLPCRPTTNAGQVSAPARDASRGKDGTR